MYASFRIFDFGKEVFRIPCDFSAYSRTSPNSDAGAESDELLFPIEEVTETAGNVGNAKTPAYIRTSNIA